jgi:hypothetical protein
MLKYIHPKNYNKVRSRTKSIDFNKKENVRKRLKEQLKLG